MTGPAWLRGRRSLRMRVALAAAGAIVVAVAGLGVAVQLLLSRHLHSELDGTLHERAAQIAQLSATAPALLNSTGMLDVAAGPRLLDVEVLDRHGRLVSASLALHGQTIPAAGLVAAAIGAARDGYADAVLDGRPVRVYVAPLPDLGGAAAGGAVVVAASTDDVTQTLEQSRRLIVGGAIAAAALAFPLSLMLARRALRPLERLSAGAAAIERTGDASMRLPAATGTTDEVARLTRTLNRMLAALERAREFDRRFVADASHELRNPVTALRGNAAYLRSHGPDDAALADLAADAERLSKLLDDLLALAREDAAAAPAEPVALAEVAANVAGGDGEVVVATDGPGWGRGDRRALERALANLVENAHRHGPAGGPVTITVESTPADVTLAVTDSGRGIPAGLADAATQRFWRGAAGASDEGSGLGLALVRATAERHGGQLAIAGPRFAIRLPALRPLSDGRSDTAPEEPRRVQ